MDTLMMHPRYNKPNTTFRITKNYLESQGQYPVLDIHHADGVNVTVFPSWEQLKELHIALSVFMLDHPEQYPDTTPADDLEIINLEV